MAEAKTLVPILLLMRQTRKDDPHMNSGGIALRHVQDVGQFAISIRPQRNTPIAQPWKEKGRDALRQVPVIAIGDEHTFSSPLLLGGGCSRILFWLVRPWLFILLI